MTVTEWLFNPSGLTPHGFCLLWEPGLIYLHAISDGVIALAYFSIPLALASFVKRRSDLEYGWVIQLFSAFILACGTTHLLSIATLWWPIYGIEGLVKVVTAALSLATAALLWPLIPKLVALPSPAQLSRLNLQLAAQVQEQETMSALLRQSEAQVRQINADLELRVVDRTAALVAANQKLTETLSHRDLLLQEVYHRVKNNLQVIDSIVLLQERKLSDPDAKDSLKSLRSRVHALGLVHQQLMGSGDLKSFAVGQFLSELSENLLRGGANEGITISVDAIPLNIGLDIAIPLGLLVTELVTNSIKHAFRDGLGHIDLGLTRIDSHSVALCVSDNGRGLDSGADPSGETSGGLGMTLIQGLIKQLDATMTVRQQGGTATQIIFPYPG
jgi:two-component sensor histidine kinase